MRPRVDAVLKNAEAVWRVVDEDLSITTPEGSDGLCLERNFYKDDGKYVADGIYELSAWGVLQPSQFELGGK
jgi:hypothetical protein